jgi:hypothetical protein
MLRKNDVFVGFSLQDIFEFLKQYRGLIQHIKKDEQ